MYQYKRDFQNIMSNACVCDMSTAPVCFWSRVFVSHIICDESKAHISNISNRIRMMKCFQDKRHACLLLNMMWDGNVLYGGLLFTRARTHNDDMIAIVVHCGFSCMLWCMLYICIKYNLLYICDWWLFGYASRAYTTHIR